MNGKGVRRRRKESEETVQNLEEESVGFLFQLEATLNHLYLLSSSWLLFPLYSDKLLLFRYIVWTPVWLRVFWHSTYFVYLPAMPSVAVRADWQVHSSVQHAALPQPLMAGSALAAPCQEGWETGSCCCLSWNIYSFCTIRTSLAVEDLRLIEKPPPSWVNVFMCCQMLCCTHFFLGGGRGGFVLNWAFFYFFPLKQSLDRSEDMLMKLHSNFLLH